MPVVESRARHLTKAYIHLGRLTDNLRLLQALVGRTSVWPVLKANAYGHDALIVASHLVRLGYHTLCVADVQEAAALADTGVNATFVVLSATLPQHSEALVGYECEPVVCTLEMIESLAHSAKKARKRLSVHLKVDTGMGRLGIRPEEAVSFLQRCRDFPWLKVRGLMSHFPRADETEKSYSLEQLGRFRRVARATIDYGIEIRHLANSAAIFDLPESHFDAVRPGIALYGLAPSPTIANRRVSQLKPVLEWRSRITFLKQVAAGTGLSYGHAFYTRKPSLIATVPIGYGDGLARNLTNEIEVLVRGMRCSQVGRITMDMSLIDVTALGGRVESGDEVVVIGRQGNEEITADELAAKAGTINYEIVTCISHRVPRVAV
ncbi:MAG: alanine racemase [Alphaproteobacteria bacterium]